MHAWDEVIRNAKLFVKNKNHESAMTEFKKILEQPNLEKIYMYEAYLGCALCCYLAAIPLQMNQKDKSTFLEQTEIYLKKSLEFLDEKTINYSLDIKMALIVVVQEQITCFLNGEALLKQVESKNESLRLLVDEIKQNISKKESLELRILVVRNTIEFLKKQSKGSGSIEEIKFLDKIGEHQIYMIALEKEKQQEKNGVQLNLSEIALKFIEKFISIDFHLDTNKNIQDQEADLKSKVANLISKKRNVDDLYKKNVDDYQELKKRKKASKQQLTPEIEIDEKKYQELLKKKDSLKSFLEKHNLLGEDSNEVPLLSVNHAYQSLDLSMLLEIEKQRNKTIAELEGEITRLEKSLEEKMGELEAAIKKSEQEREMILSKKEKINQQLTMLSR